MNDLILVENISGKAMTTSLKIAEVFGKEHRNVLKDIREKQHLFGLLNFEQSEYVNNQGHKMPIGTQTMITVNGKNKFRQLLNK